MKTSHITTAIKSLELQKKKYLDKALAIQAKIDSKQQEIYDINTAMDELTYSIEQLKKSVSTTETVSA